MDQIVVPFDLGRMLFGDQPPLFYLEIIVRTLIIYAYAFLLMRWLGSRTVGQLSTIEFLLVIALGSAVGDPMFYPDVPLFHAMVVVTGVVLLNKLLDVLVARNHNAERLIDGAPIEVVRNGIINYRNLETYLLGQREFFQELRRHGVENLGEITVAYLEANGTFSVFRNSAGDNRPGLQIVPPWEIEPPPTIHAHDTVKRSSLLGCRRCGRIQRAEAGTTVIACSNCGYESFNVEEPANGGGMNHSYIPPAKPISDRS